jgi:hypothetical protein
MPRFEPAEFGRLLARLTPQELRQAEGLVADARKRAEAVLEIDARADAGGPAASWRRTRCSARTGSSPTSGSRRTRASLTSRSTQGGGRNAPRAATTSTP